MSADKYQSIFSRQMATIVCIVPIRRKYPDGYIVVVHENFPVNKRVYWKLTVEILLSGLLSVFFFKFYT